MNWWNSFPAKVVFCVIGGLLGLGRVDAASPSAEQALKLAPIQEGVDYSTPSATDLPKCTIEARKVDGKVGWVVEDPNGLPLRRFIDTNGDNTVDQWCYFKDGLEVYRDIDSDNNGKADQYRWFHTGGIRWGIDRDEDGKIDSWKTISPEEVSAEVVFALARRDAAQFARVVLTPEELKSLGLGEKRQKALDEKLRNLMPRLKQLMAGSGGLDRKAEWTQFSGNQPGVVPAGTEGSTKDLRVYENVVAICQSGDKHLQVQIGTLVQVGDVWKVIDPPQVVGADTQLSSDGFFFRAAVPERAQGGPDAPSDQTRDVMAEIEKIRGQVGQANSPAEVAKLNARLADLHEQLIAQTTKPEERAMWIRQTADMIMAAVQSNTYPDGPKRLRTLMETLSKNPADRSLIPYVEMRILSSEHALETQTEKDFVKLQTQWIKRLEEFLAKYPDSPDSAEAMLQLGMDQEFAGEEEECKKWYNGILQKFPNSPSAVKAKGAITRLDSVGRVVPIQGRGVNGEAVDVARYRGKVVLVHYWATWSNTCASDMATIKDLLNKYGRSFVPVGVNLDMSSKDVAAFLQKNSASWPQIYEEGGLDSGPANDMGILTVPTMLLIDRDGKVANRNVSAADLERELKRLLP
jgi:thiol-disulfide isomerase/thioredoxin